MKKSSTWAALRNPAFRRLWIATVISGTCVAAHDNAATWMMNLLVASPFLISLMSTLASLPFFLFTLPAGALADKVNRRKLVCAINLCLAFPTLALALLGWLRLLNPPLVLVSVFVIGVGFAFNAPAWTSMVPQVVSESELPSASTLGGLQLTISGIVGPALAALLDPLVGPNFVFALNGVSFLLLAWAIRAGQQLPIPKGVPSEKFFESFTTVLRNVRSVHRIQVVLVRSFLFALFISVIPALIPVICLTQLHLNSSNLGLLFASMGVGSVIGAVFIISWLRARFSPDAIILSANLLLVSAYMLMAFIRRTDAFFVVAALAGVGWTMSASELWVAAQRAMPSWALGRMNATVIMISQGAMALGGLIWASAGTIFGAGYTLFGAAILFLASLVVARRFSINFARNFEEKVLGHLATRAGLIEVTPLARTADLLAA
jgi:MFS family permease